MLAIDTNVVVRFLTGDHPTQSEQARAIIAEQDVWVASTVLLETEWVLRSAYDFPKDRVIAALRAFAGLPRVKLEAPHHAARAMDWADAGMDFADALHLASAMACEAFVTFDRRMAKASEQAGGIEVRVP